MHVSCVKKSYVGELEGDLIAYIDGLEFWLLLNDLPTECVELLLRQPNKWYDWSVYNCYAVW